MNSAKYNKATVDEMYKLLMDYKQMLESMENLCRPLNFGAKLAKNPVYKKLVRIQKKVEGK